MTLAHISDTHLGFRAYGRTTADGLNQREHDVMVTFRACLDAIANREPDIVVHSGDLFDMVRPGNHTIVGAFRSISEFQARRGGKPFLLIGGNHDTPRISESGNILKLFASIPGLQVVTEEPQWLDFPSLDLEALCIPNKAIKARSHVSMRPKGDRKHSLLTLHGLAREALPEASDFNVSDTRHELWTYVALGDFHVHQAYGDNVCYAGSTDYTSSNIWDEGERKGWVWFDLGAGKLEFNRVRTRPVVDLPQIDATGMTPEELEHKLLANARWDSGSDPIVRQKVVNAHLDLRGRMGPSVFRELSARCLAYNHRFFQPEAATSASGGAKGEEFSIRRSWEEHVVSASLPSGVSKEELRELGLKLIGEVAEVASAPA